MEEIGTTHPVLTETSDTCFAFISFCKQMFVCLGVVGLGD